MSPGQLPATPRPVTIAAMRRRHLRGVHAVELAANSHPWAQSLFAGELSLGELRCYVVALDGSTVVGFGGLMYTGYEAHVTNVAVDPGWLRRGMATAIMSVLMDACVARGVDDVTLEVRVSNVAAQRLYHRFGFIPGGIRPAYYREPTEDAIIMWATDIAAPDMQTRLAAVPWPSGMRRDPSVAPSTIGP